MMPAEQPTPLPVKPAAIPDELKRQPRWVGWRYVQRDGRWTKVPVNAKTGGLASTTNRATWTTYERALSAAEQHRLAGIGFVLGDGYAGVDLDNSLAPATGKLAAWAEGDVLALASYTEVSPSGKGVKVFLKGALPPGPRRRNQYEMYDEDRFFTVTGHHVIGTPATVEARTDELAALHARIFPKTAQPDPPDFAPAPAPAAQPSPLTDLEIIDRASRARDGGKFAALWGGDTTGYPSQSEADLALCSLLAFWCGPDEGRIDRLFRLSGLYRADKWKRADYRASTLAKAIDRDEFYTPPEKNPPRMVFLTGEAAEEAADKPAYPWIVGLGDLLAEPDEAETWLVDGLWRAQTMGIVVGPPKTYKSFFAQEMAVALATGTPLFGRFAVTEPVSVIYVQEESARLYLRKRFRAILAGREMHPAAVADGLQIVTNQRFRLDSPEQILRLIEQGIRPHRPGIVMFDPLRQMHWQDENSAEAMMPILEALKSLRDAYGTSILVIHHNNKNPLYSDPAESIRGSTSIWAAMDGGIFISKSDTDGTMKVKPVLKEGGEAAPFLYRVESAPDAIRFDVVDLAEAGKTVDDNALVRAVAQLGWCDAKDVAAEVGISERRVRPRLLTLAERGTIRQRISGPGKAGGRPGTLFGPKGASDDDPDF